MNNERLKKIWKDLVGSKIISVILIALGTSILIFFKSLIQNEKFVEAFKSFWYYKLPLWGICLLAVLIWGFTLLIKKRKRDFNPPFIYDEDTLHLDRRLFTQIQNEILPQNGSIAFLRENDFAEGGFDINSLNDFFEIKRESINSDFEFLNPELEEVKGQLIIYISRLISFTEVNTFTTHNGMQSIPPEWELDQNNRFWKAVNDINQTSSDICNKYDELIRKGRRLLKI